MALWELFGVYVGLILGSFGALFCCPLAKHENLDFDDPLERNRVFSGPWGSQNQSKIGPESLLALELAPRASWRSLGLDFWSLWGSQNGPKRVLESKLKLEAFFKLFLKLPSKGRRQEGGPSGRGLLGSLPTVDAGFPKLCLSQCFRKLHLASLTASSEPERLSGRILGATPTCRRPPKASCRVG